MENIIAQNEHVTLRELRTQISATSEGRLPTFKQLMEMKSAVVAQKVVNTALLTVYQNGYAVYEADGARTVMAVDRCKEYTYDFDNGTRITIQQELLENEEWSIRLLMEGEMRLEHNHNKTFDKFECVSLECDGSDWSAVASVDFLQEDNEVVLAEIELCMLYEAMDKLTKRQMEVIRLYFYKGMSQQAIADELNRLGVLSPAEYKKEQGSGYKTVFQTHSRAKWTAVAVLRVLTNEVYMGTLIQGKESTPNYKVRVREKKPKEEWIRVENAHEAIISRTDFELISDILQKDTRVSTGKSAVSVYSGYLVCADCGCSMVRKKVRSGSLEYVYYVCSGNKKDKDICSSHRISENTLNMAITKTLQLHLKQLGDLQESIRYIRETSGNSDKIKKLVLQSEKRKEDIEKYNRLKLECYEDYKKELITQDEYMLFKKELDNRIEEIQRAITELGKKKRMLLDGGYEKESLLEKFLTSKEIELKRSILVRFISRIYVYEDHRIEIIFRYQDEIRQLLGIVEEIKQEVALEEVI